ncbi:MAG: AMP-binding protein [Gemmatimonadaceae bacterium]|nr:AMP-binding protein [Gemmatimonadaceae bacterium]NUQ93564.1 AMP-binding protein [Gemmatimonadaceae bacterium]NUR18581.1 AMP-binding protein [Gemmatimonadaceae bacterium]NUS96661.1 AMP-binding protein [Gemmatimonadaceae bacterium]
MTDPLALLPLAAAARGGTVDGLESSALVAAGLTLLQRSAPLVRALAGRRAGILLPTSPAFLTALAASEGRGAVLMNPLAAPRELAYQIADAQVGAVFTTAALGDRLPRELPRVLLDDAPRSATIVAGGSTRAIDLGSHFPLALEGDPSTEGRDEEAAIVYTSAMSGRPLGAILTHRNLLANARATVQAAELADHDHFLAALPFSHLFGLVVAGVAPLLAGARVTTMPRFNPLRALGRLEDDVTHFVGVPAMYVAMLAALEGRGEAFRAAALRVCICGGAPLPMDVQDRWFDATGVELRQGYGLTEASPVALFNRTGMPNVRGTLGLPYPGVEVTVRDPASGRECAAGAAGEISVRGPTVFAGYVGAGAGAPTGLEVRDGWLRTGDLGVVRDDGRIEFRGVRKPMFTRNGFNIYPRELELAVAELSGVESAAVRAIPDPAHENGIELRVRGDVSEADVRVWCAERLSAYKQPTVVIVGG